MKGVLLTTCPKIRQVKAIPVGQEITGESPWSSYGIQTIRETLRQEPMGA